MPSKLKSKKNIKNNNYITVVVLDTNFFDGIKPRYWGKRINKFVHNNLAGKTINIYHENKEVEKISFAKANERVKKDGAKNSHKVIDKLARNNNNNIKNLIIIQIDEVLQASKTISSNKENSHQWLDTNGWYLKKVYLQTKNGMVYEALLNIAKTRDGRNILYDINKIKKVDDAAVPSIKGLS